MNRKNGHTNSPLAGRWKTGTGLSRNPALLVVVIGLLFLVLGLVRGEAHQVWLRAVQICLGCIGIG